MLPGSSEHKDMAEMEEPLGTSPPLELRRSTSNQRPTIAVPHSLQSPQDRATGTIPKSHEKYFCLKLNLAFPIDSPQVAQVFVHNARIPHPHYPDVSARFYENPRATLQATNEPPPAHRGVLPPNTPYAAPDMNAASADLTMHPHSKIIDREREREKERTSSIPGKITSFFASQMKFKKNVGIKFCFDENC